MYLELFVKSEAREEFINITSKVAEAVKKSGVKRGRLTLFVPHTTAALAINEAADPCVMNDLLNYLKKAVPPDDGYTHAEGNSDAHIKAALLGSSKELIVLNGELDLGTWQAIFFAEFDGPRTRRVRLLVS